MNLKNIIARIPVLGKILLIIYRYFISLKYFFEPFMFQIKWLFASNETTNFTYELTKLNKKYLISFISLKARNP